MKSLSIFALLLSLVISSSAKAYDVDTHFYSTYAMARHACIKHNVALKIASSAQWMDESFISDPTSMLLMIPDGLHKRRLLHFPATRAGNKISVAGQREALGFDSLLASNQSAIEYIIGLRARPEDAARLKTLLFSTETGKNDRMASEMFMEGLKEGNLMKASTSLHVIEDSFAHAGTPAESGHSFFWHWPDRPFFNVPKYKEMTNAVFKGLVAIRGMLPPQALDPNLKTLSNQANCDMDADSLSNAYFDQIKDVISINMLTDKDYVEGSLRWFIDAAIKNAYLIASTAKVDSIVKAVHIDGKIDTYEALARLVKILMAGQMGPDNGALAWAEMLDVMQLKRQDSQMPFNDFIAQFGTAPVGMFNINSQEVDTFVNIVVRNLLRFNVPEGIEIDDHLMELENDTKSAKEGEAEKPRQIEMRLREQNMQAYIERTFGEKIKFESNNTSDRAGFGKEIRKEPEANPPKFPNDGYEHVTFNLNEKNQFDHMIFNFLYPNLSARKNALETITAVVHGIVTAEDPIYKGALRAWAAKRLWDVLPTLIHDLVSEHSGPREDNWIYRNPHQYKQYKDEGKFKPLLIDDDLWNIENLVGQKADLNRG